MESFIPQVQLKQKFWVTEDSKAKLVMAGAKCLDMVSHREHYYDTALDDLAMAGLWLSQRNQQWSLVVEPREEGSTEEAAGSDPETWEPLRWETTKTVQKDSNSWRMKPREMESYRNLNDQQQELTGGDREDAAAKSSCAYTELVGESEIITYLAAHFHIDLNDEKGKTMTVEDFQERAGIQHYASKQIITQTMYILSNKYYITIQREESSWKEFATVSLDVDILNICKGFEDIEKLATYLGFEQQEVPSEPKLMR